VQLRRNRVQRMRLAFKDVSAFTASPSGPSEASLGGLYQLHRFDGRHVLPMRLKKRASTISTFFQGRVGLHGLSLRPFQRLGPQT